MYKAAIGILVILAAIIGLGLHKNAKAQEIPPQTPIQRVVIKEDGGGRLDEYLRSLGILKASGVGIKLDGMCASACTLLTSTKLSFDICITKNAVLGIHHPFMMTGEREINYTIPAVQNANDIWKQLFFDTYPKWIQDYINKNNGAPDVYKGASPNDLLKIDYTELSKHMATCQ